jgi:hypothetical protein
MFCNGFKNEGQGIAVCLACMNEKCVFLCQLVTVAAPRLISNLSIETNFLLSDAFPSSPPLFLPSLLSLVFSLSPSRDYHHVRQVRLGHRAQDA